jgi:DNA-binding response OmpR family regulator
MRVLVVDDNRDARVILSRLLQIAGHEPCVATNGERALQIAAEFLPEAVLLDIGLPKKDGYAVAKSLRDIPALQGIRIALVSGFEADAAKQSECGIDYHLCKPAGLREILMAIGAKDVAG